MDIKESAELTAFRAEVRDWVHANLPDNLRPEFVYSGMEENEPVP